MYYVVNLDIFTTSGRFGCKIEESRLHLKMLLHSFFGAYKETCRATLFNINSVRHAVQKSGFDFDLVKIIASRNIDLQEPWGLYELQILLSKSPIAEHEFACTDYRRRLI